MILKFQRATLLALIVGVPVIVTPSLTLDPFNVPKFALLLAGCSLVAALWAAQAVWGRSPAIHHSDLIVPAAFAIPLVVAWFFSSQQAWALFGQYSRLQGLVPGILFALFAIEVAVFLRGRARSVMWALATSGGLVGLGQLTGVMGWSVTGGVSDASTIGNSNFVGGFLAIALPLAVHLWWTSDRGDGRETWIAIALTVLIAEGLILSFSQGGQLAAVSGVCVLLAARVDRRWGKILAVGVAATIPIAMVLVVSLPALQPVGGHTATLRSYWWGSALALAKESPVTGHGPNAFALEGSRNRPLADALAHRGYVPGFTPLQVDHQTTDDPHSVPLSILVSAGGLGVLGLALATWWLLKEMVRRGKETESAHIAFVAALAAYLTQSLLTVDEISLRLALWACVGGFLAGIPTHAGTDTKAAAVPTRIRRVAGTVALACLVGVGLYASITFFRADQLARSGTIAFAQDDPALGESLLRRALSLRDDATYKQVLAENLGIAALEGASQARSMVADMQVINRYLSEIPDVGAFHAYARLLNYWGEHDVSGDIAALEVYAKAHELDPNNPMIVVEHAEALTDLGEASTARRMLAPLEDDLTSAMPEFWGALAMVRLQDGDEEGAEEALELGVQLDPHDCRVSMARELLAQAVGGGPPNRRARMALALACDPGLYARFLERAGLAER